MFRVELPDCRDESAITGASMSASPLIHVVDDDESLRTALLRLLAPPASRPAATHRRASSCWIRRPIGRAACCSTCGCRGRPGSTCRRPSLAGASALPVVFLTGHADVASSVRAMKAGAVDFLTKPVERDVLFEALERALARNARQRAAHREAEALQARFETLTPREREVFDGIVAGKLNKQIAGELGIAERTVKLHRASVMAKLGAAPRPSSASWPSGCGRPTRGRAPSDGSARRTPRGGSRPPDAPGLSGTVDSQPASSPLIPGLPLGASLSARTTDDTSHPQARP